jgi:hypothetical protein
MASFSIELAGRDVQHLRRWEHVLRRENWGVTIRTGNPAAAARDARFILLAEIDGSQASRPDAWLREFGETKPASLVAFGEPGLVSNRTIAALLAQGADDFIYKDIDSTVLTAKIKALLRRVIPHQHLASGPLKSSDGLITAHCGERRVTVRNGRGDRDLPNITPKEFGILTLLLCNEGKIVNRETILDNIWADKAYSVNPETVDKHVESIRKKMGKYGVRIRTIYGSGYLLAPGGNQA